MRASFLTGVVAVAVLTFTAGCPPVDPCDQSDCTTGGGKATGGGNAVGGGTANDAGRDAGLDAGSPDAGGISFAYLKASNPAADDGLRTLALSQDGMTLAVGAVGEDSSATGVDGDQTDNAATGSGAVYVFSKSANGWAQQAYLKASNTGASDGFGGSVALSADGNTLAVGASQESSNATGINGNQADNGAANSGAVYIFVRSGSTWVQQAYLKASNTEGGDLFGLSVAISGDGSTVVVGAPFESSSAQGVNGAQGNNGASHSGAVYVFTRTGTAWAQEAYLKSSNSEANDRVGAMVAVSADGTTLASFAPGEASSAAGVNGDSTNNSQAGSGALLRVHTRGNHVDAAGLCEVLAPSGQSALRCRVVTRW